MPFQPVPPAEPGTKALSSAFNALRANVELLGKESLCRRYSADTQSIPRTQWTKAAFGESVRSTGRVTPNTTADIFTINEPGVYFVSTSTRWASNTSGARHLVIGNGGGSMTIRYAGNSVPGGPDALSPAVSTMIPLDAGSTLSVWVYHNATGVESLNLSPSTQSNHLTIRYCGES